jgi:hypothetical protein
MYQQARGYASTPTMAFGAIDELMVFGTRLMQYLVRGVVARSLKVHKLRPHPSPWVSDLNHNYYRSIKPNSRFKPQLYTLRGTLPWANQLQQLCVTGHRHQPGSSRARRATLHYIRHTDDISSRKSQAFSYLNFI